MTIPSYSTTAASNDSADGINWAENQAPSTVNNSARQMLADTRTQWNDAEWFEYRDGTPIAQSNIVYVANNQFKITGADATAYWHVGRRVKIVDVSPLTTYTTITATSYGAGATTVTIDSTALTAVDLVAYASTIPFVNSPLPEDQTIDTLTIGTSILIGGTGAANTLDDYEEGTWTPVIADATTAGNTATTGTISGKYTKVGNFVKLTARIDDIDTTGMTGGNVVYIRDFPFAPGAATIRQIGTLLMAGITYEGDPHLRTTSSNTYSPILEGNSAGAITLVTVADIASGTADLELEISYTI